MITPADKIYVSGHRGMVGSAVVRLLRRQGFGNLLLAGRQRLNLTEQSAVFDFFAENRPQVQIICAAVVGGIFANDTLPGSFIGQNLMMQTNLLEAARRFGCRKTLFIGSGCIYPRDAAQPMREEQLLTGALEKTNQWYAMAKLAGIKMGQAYRRQYGLDIVSVLPCNLYGPGDNFHEKHSHVIPALIRKAHAAKTGGGEFTIWGTGKALREFLHVDDLSEAMLFLLRQKDAPEIVNIGFGEEISIADTARLVARAVGARAAPRYDNSYPDGTPRKLLDSSRMFNMGWRPKIALAGGIAATYDWFLQNEKDIRVLSPARETA